MTGGARRRLGPDERRTQLVDIGVELIRTQPLDLLTAGHIAERAGVSKALVFHYFPSHRDLQAAVARATAATMLASFQEVSGSSYPSIEARVEAGIDAFLSFVEQQPQSYASLASAAVSDEALHRIFEDTREGVTDIVMTHAGIAEPSPHIRAVVRGWIALAERMITDFVAEPAMGRDELVRFLRQAAFALFAEAVRPTPAEA
jgi:AcrR family transcriptional regulator